jgi:glycogen phosphorylase
MRLLIDVHGLELGRGLAISCGVFSYTNHTLLPEALETWPVRMLEKLLPRHLEIIYRINREFLDGVSERYPGDNDRRRRMSIVDEAGFDGRRVRMAWLATVGSRKVNGVAELHSEARAPHDLPRLRRVLPRPLRQRDQWRDAAALDSRGQPAPRALLDERLGGLGQRPRALRELAAAGRRRGVPRASWAIKQANKQRLAGYIRRQTGIVVSPDSLFDVQIKRIHEYKRQLLNLLHVITRYNRIRQDPERDWQPRTVVFAGKAAPAYTMAKRIIQLINNVAAVINDDWTVGDRLKVVFLPNYSVSAAELIIPAADLSEQISTAGMEASGTGNMKFAMNGALTIGTLDGANIEIRDAVGAENIFIFGLTAEEVAARRAQGYYPIELARSNAELGEVLRQIRDGFFSPQDLRRFAPVVDALTAGRRALPVPRRLRGLRRHPGARGRGVPGHRRLDPQGDHQHAQHGPLLQRSRHPRVCGAHLGAGADRIDMATPPPSISCTN